MISGLSNWEFHCISSGFAGQGLYQPIYSLTAITSKALLRLSSMVTRLPSYFTWLNAEVINRVGSKVLACAAIALSVSFRLCDGLVSLERLHRIMEQRFLSLAIISSNNILALSKIMGLEN